MKYYFQGTAKAIKGLPKDLPKELLEKAISKSLEGTKILTIIALSNDFRAFATTEGISEEDLEKVIPIIELTCVLELLRRAGKIKVDKDLTFNVNDDFQISRA